ncbi:MAG: SGNH/GDSL hydrolase family protein, partial [Victivallaceae bacterium]
MDKLKLIMAMACVAISFIIYAGNREERPPYVMYEHTRGDAEMYSTLYTGYGAIGVYELMPERCVFNTIQLRFYTSAAVDISYWIVERDSIASFNVLEVPILASGTIPASDAPLSPGLFTLRLPSPVVAEKGKYLVVVLRCPGAEAKLAYFSAQSTAAPFRHTLFFAWNSTWNGTIYEATPTTYYSTTLKLLYESDEVRKRNGIGAVVPPEIYAVVGRECNVYLDNIFADSYKQYGVDVTCAVGKQQNERYTIIPTTSGTSAWSMTVHNQAARTVIDYATSSLVVATADAGSGTTPKVLVIGDSLVAAGVITSTLLDIAGSDVMGVTLIGTQGTAPNLHEGRGGWDIKSYCTATAGNPFWISGTVDFPGYLSANSLVTPDWVFIELGTNSVGGYVTDEDMIAAMPALIGYYETLIASIQAAGAINVGIMLPPPPSTDQDAFGTSYGCGFNQFQFKRNIALYNRAMLDHFKGVTGVYVLSSNVSLDTINNMQIGR